MNSIQMTKEDYNYAVNSYTGFCTECGVEWDGYEPDARGCLCEECGAAEVYGVEELLLMGMIEFVE